MKYAVVCWLWKGNRDFTPEHVDVLRRMVKRHLTTPHRFVCFVSDEYNVSAYPDIDWLPIPPEAEALAELKTPEGDNFPTCYRRLWIFSDQAQAIAENVLLVDVDMVVTGNIDHLLRVGSSTFVGWRPRLVWGPQRVAGGLYYLKTGAHTDVWTDFSVEGVTEARKAGFRGSDQAWLSYKLADSCDIYPDDCGVESIRDIPAGTVPPLKTRIVQFNGPRKPWHPRNPAWVLEHWR